MIGYAEKRAFLARYQNERCPMKCAGCNQDLKISALFGMLDLDHILPRCREGKKFLWQNENLREFIDSILNLRLVPHNCHIGGKFESARYTDREALIFESILRTETFGEWTYGDVVNMRSDLSFVDIQSVVEDVMTIFNSMTEAKK